MKYTAKNDVDTLQMQAAVDPCMAKLCIVIRQVY